MRLSSMANLKRVFVCIILSLLIAGNQAITQESYPLKLKVDKQTLTKELKKTSLDKTSKEKIINWISEKLNEIYVFPDVAKKMENHIRSKFKDGAYDSVSEIAEYAQVLTHNLQDISHDKHLWVRHAPVPAPGEDASDEDKARRQQQRLEQMKYNNFAFKKAEQLAGNVGYLRFNGFVDAKWGGDTAIAALNFLAYCDALIIDLRDNGGGSPSMIQLITSYFFDESNHINSFYIRKTDKIQQFWTSAHVKGKRMTGVDLYVLTSSRTFSAAEEFTYNLKNMKRATIVGETTGGGAHPVDYHQNNDLKIGISVPFGRAINPISGTNWEGTGVEPDVKTSREEAFDTAYRLALKNLHEKAKGPRKVQLKWMLEYQEKRSNPVHVSIEKLKTYVGKYGPRKITLEQGKLYIQREGNPKFALFAITEDTFGLDGLEYFRIRFEKNASEKIVAILGLYDDGTKDRSSKDK